VSGYTLTVQPSASLHSTGRDLGHVLVSRSRFGEGRRPGYEQFLKRSPLQERRVDDNAEQRGGRQSDSSADGSGAVNDSLTHQVKASRAHFNARTRS
jgi:hypothetical protein